MVAYIEGSQVFESQYFRGINTAGVGAETSQTNGITEKRVADLAQKAIRIPSNLNAYTIENTDWSGASVTKAGTGVRGAWFFQEAGKGSVVVKGQENPEKQIMGTVFLRSMGFNSPDAKLVLRTSEEGVQLSEKGHTLGLNRRNPTHYIVMNRVNGVAFESLTSSQNDVELVKKNLSLIGELAIYDLVIGNTDRMDLKENSFNAGNLMFQDGVVHAIDTDVNEMEEERFGFAKLALSRIARNIGGYDEKLVRMLETNMPGQVEPGVFPPENIRAGMVKAIGNLKIFNQNKEENEELYIKSCNQRGCDLKLLPDSLQKIFQAIGTN